MGLKYSENRGYMICENPRVYSYITSDKDLLRIDQTTDFKFKDDSLAKSWNLVNITKRYNSLSLSAVNIQFANVWAKFMQHILVKNNLSWDKPWEELNTDSTINIVRYSHYRVLSIDNYFPLFSDFADAVFLICTYWKYGEIVYNVIDNYGLLVYFSTR